MTRIVRIAAPTELSAVYALRHEVFVIGQGVPPEIERDELDPTAEHALALVNDELVATGRLVNGRIDEDGRLVSGTEGTVGMIGRMAVTARARGQGLGRDVLDLLVNRAAERELPAVELHAQVHARAFYERAGFVPFGDVYLEAGIKHVGMRRDL